MTLNAKQIEALLRGLSDSPFDSGMKSRLREKISSHIPIATPNPSFIMKTYYGAAAAAIAVLIGGTGLYTFGNPEITRASVLYPVKQAAEAVDGALAVTSLQEVEHHMKLSEQRAREAAILAEGGSEKDLAVTFEEISDETDEALEAANEIGEVEDALGAAKMLADTIAATIATIEGFNNTTIEGDVNILVQQLSDVIVNIRALIVQIEELNAEGAVNIEINVYEGTAEEEDDDDSGIGTGSGSEPVKVTVCHKGKNELSISENAVYAHLAHGDTLGECLPQDVDAVGGDDADSDDNAFVPPGQLKKSEGNDTMPPGQLKKQENNVLNSSSGNKNNKNMKKD